MKNNPKGKQTTLNHRVVQAEKKLFKQRNPDLYNQRFPEVNKLQTTQTMQKVITITTHIGTFNNDEFKETQYPELNALLQQGYIVKEFIPIVPNRENHWGYSITFILELPKDNKITVQ